jgi:N-acetylglucosamine kinase-like BadF-type ATPase
MLLIADSGSTKTDWRLLVPDGENDLTSLSFATSGINPFFLSGDEIVTLLNSELCSRLEVQEPAVAVSAIKRIFFYGAEIASKEKSDLVADSLRTVFPTAQTIEAHSDLFGAARGLCGRESGIACILGTGSNSCYYDGHAIVDNVPPCGFILGDEGGGAVMGRKLLSAFLKRDLPEYLCDKLRHECGLSKDIILERVYRQQFPNRFLAQHAQFLGQYQSEEAIQAIITNSFEEFFDRNVLKYPQCHDVPIHFTGSIAFHFAEFLRPVAASRQLTIGKITKSPIDEIARYHAY